MTHHDAATSTTVMASATVLGALGKGGAAPKSQVAILLESKIGKQLAGVTAGVAHLDREYLDPKLVEANGVVASVLSKGVVARKSLGAHVASQTKIGKQLAGVTAGVAHLDREYLDPKLVGASAAVAALGQGGSFDQEYARLVGEAPSGPFAPELFKQLKKHAKSSKDAWKGDLSGVELVRADRLMRLGMSVTRGDLIRWVRAERLRAKREAEAAIWAALVGFIGVHRTTQLITPDPCGPATWTRTGQVELPTTLEQRRPSLTRGPPALLAVA